MFRYNGGALNIRQYRFIFVIAGLLFILATVSYGDRGEEAKGKNDVALDMKRKALDCNICHYCQEPSKENLCLFNCPRYLTAPDQDLKSSPEDGPETVTIDALEHYYEPTEFNHKGHAEMAAMSRGCLECHHYSPEGYYPACQECHRTEASGLNLKQPGLKGAYHRQCLNCHREWSSETACEVCHALKSKELSQGAEKKSKKHFPVVKPPADFTFKTQKYRGSTVSFDHTSHAEDFDLRCQNCHRGTGCGPCHEQQAKPESKTDKTSPVACLDCHKELSCSDCHEVPAQAAPFDHDKTKFPLRPFHKKVTCRACHTTQERHYSAPHDCTKCHQEEWIASHFKHESIGFSLDETHQELECTECHGEKGYSGPFNCTECHEEISYPDFVPGEEVE